MSSRPSPTPAAGAGAAKPRKPLLSRIPADFVRAVLKGHSALGLAFAAAIYLVCLTGSIAVFAHDFELWERAGTARTDTAAPRAVQRALGEAVARAGPGVEHGYIQMPSAERPQLLVSIDTKDHGDKLWIADAQGRLVGRGEAPLTEFLTRLHINLHIPGSWGLFLVGMTGVALLSSLISGVLAHPRILRDAFHLRIGGSRRLQEADLHNRLGVWALPFHIVVSLTGALLGLTTLIVGVLGLALFQGDVNKVYELFIPKEPKEDARPAPVMDLTPMFAQIARAAPGGRVDLILLEHPTERGGAALFNVEHQNGRLANMDSFAFTRDGKLYHTARASDNNLGENILASIGKLHFGWFGGGIVKIGYALLGLGLTYLTASGVNIWLARRRDKRNPAPGWERLWASVTWGQPAALALAALVAMAAGPTVAVGSLVATWGVASLLALLASFALVPAILSRGGQALTAAALIGCALLHATLRPGTDPIAWTIDITLLLIGAGLGWLVLRQRPGAPASVSAPL